MKTLWLRFMIFLGIRKLDRIVPERSSGKNTAYRDAVSVHDLRPERKVQLNLSRHRLDWEKDYYRSNLSAPAQNNIDYGMDLRNSYLLAPGFSETDTSNNDCSSEHDTHHHDSPSFDGGFGGGDFSGGGAGDSWGDSGSSDNNSSSDW